MFGIFVRSQQLAGGWNLPLMGARFELGESFFWKYWIGAMGTHKQPSIPEKMQKRTRFRQWLGKNLTNVVRCRYGSLNQKRSMWTFLKRKSVADKIRRGESVWDVSVRCSLPVDSALLWITYWSLGSPTPAQRLSYEPECDKLARMVAAFNVIPRIGKLGDGNPDWAHIGIVFQVQSSQCNCEKVWTRSWTYWQPGGALGEPP